MSIIHKYLTGEIFKCLFFVLAAVISIYISVDFFEKIDNFMEAGLPFSRILVFLIFKIPFIIAQIIPVCILLSVIIVFGLMTKNNELIALKSSGVSIYYLLKPIFIIGLILSLLLFFISEVIVPITMERANEIWLKEVKKESAVISKEKNIWIKGDRLITHITYYNPAEKAIFGISINAFDEDFRLVRRIDAKKGLFKDGQWFLYEIIEQNLNQANNQYRIKLHEEKVENLDFLPEDLKRIIKKSEEMSFNELFNYIKKVEAEGYEATIYRVDLYAKIAFPLVCLIVCIIGAGIAFKRKIKEGLPVNVACGIGIAFLYWILHSFCVSLGYGEMLSPLVAAWSANLIFLCSGIVILLNAD
ncbi:MAG: LPS export ABC transporter permease LptG [Desulfobacterales bacterium]|jgi:lipopolysaccharide export system permease protein|nr:LPS export ABC transporter permease LptG [Desulfobacterales bacterium]